MTYQQIIIVGNVGADPQLQYTQSGIAVTNFSLAVNRKWTDQAGQQQERTTWWRVTAWRQQAEFAVQYIKKGQQIMVIGTQIEANPYKDRANQLRASLDITADTIRLLGSRSDNNADPGHNFTPDEKDIPF